MATRSYNFYITSTSTGDAKANVRIAAKGNITAICWVYSGASGADVTGFQKFELSKQSASAFTQNDAPAPVLCRFAGGNVGVASAGFTNNALLAGLQTPVAVNDVIYIHELIGGTAPASAVLYCTVVVNES